MYRDNSKPPSWMTSRPQTQSRMTNAAISVQKGVATEKELARLEQIFSLEDRIQADSSRRGKCIWSSSHHAKNKDGIKGLSDGQTFGHPVHCDCAWSKGQKENKILSHKKNSLSSRNFQYLSQKGKLDTRDSVHFDAQTDTAAISHEQQEKKMIEEFVLDDNELCLFNFYDIPVDVTKHYRMRKSAKLKTVSIIDTLSELALGATDREDDTGNVSSCAMNKSICAPSYFNHIKTAGRSSRFTSNLNHYRIKDSSFVPPYMGQETNSRNTREEMSGRTESSHPVFTNNYRKSQRNRILGTNASESEQECNIVYRKRNDSNILDFNTTSISSSGLPLSVCGIKRTPQSVNSDMETIPCSSLKRTLKYLRKAVSSTGMESDTNEVNYMRGRRHHRKHDDRDYSRMCLSDSEVRHTRVKSQGVPSGRGLRSKQKQTHSHQNLDFKSFPGISQTNENKTKTTNVLPSTRNNNELQNQNQKTPANLKQHSRVPEWIQRIFHVTKKGDLDLLKTMLKDMDASLIRNLSDHNGNNLWHVCAAYNHLECLKWLCSHDNQDVLVDENKVGLNPVVIAVKHGNLELTQWLVQHTSGVSQVAPPEGTRSLLHYAAKYGQVKSCDWLADYMEVNNIDINRRDSVGNSSLHLAAKYGHVDCVKCLILRGGDMSAKNELGFKPYNLAMCNEKEACADYLMAMEACFSLASEHLYVEADIHRLNVENTELKTHFKELLSLTRHIIRRQEKIWESLQKIKNAENSDLAIKEERNENQKNTSKDSEEARLSNNDKWQVTESWLDEYSQWLSEVTPDDKSRLQQIEENWRRVRRRQNRRIEDKSALDIIRYQFSQLLCKANDLQQGSEMRAMSSSETSLSEESLRSEEELSNTVLTASDLGIAKTMSKPYSNLSSCSSKVSNSISDNSSRERGQYLENLIEPSVINDSAERYREKELQSIPSTVQKTDCSLDAQNKIDITAKPYSQHTVSAQAVTPASHSSVSSALRWDINLRLFFDRNPELRQEGKTCSVLEVLEPSSSENEDWIQKKKKTKHSKSSCKEDRWESGNSSSSSMHSSSDCKLHSNSQVKNFHRTQVKNSNQETENNNNNNVCENSETNNNTEKSENLIEKHKHYSPYFLKSSNFIISPEQNNEILTSRAQNEVITQACHGINHQKITKCKELLDIKDEYLSDIGSTLNKWENRENGERVLNKEISHSNNCEKSNFSEPDLIKGTQKINTQCKTPIERNKIFEPNNKINKIDCSPDGDKELVSTVTADETDAKSRTAQVSSTESTDKSQPEMCNTVSSIKKKGFLLKFSLKGRWSSKQKPQSTKKIEEITPEEFRETYSRTLNPSNPSSVGGSFINDVSQESSQDNKIQHNNKQSVQITHQSKLNNKVFEKDSLNYEETKNSDCCSAIKCSVDNSNSSKVRLLPSEFTIIPPPPMPLPLRREPPPIPTLDTEDARSNENCDQEPNVPTSQNDIGEANTEDNLSCAGASIVTGVFQSSPSKMVAVPPWASALKSDSLSRPSSSASHLDLPSRSDDTYKSDFPLHKGSSASTEMLVALDTSTAGRQSPAPSEVSKTESALSPPSDVSKTESTRHLNQLGKIEETTNIHREISGSLTAFQESASVTTEIIAEPDTDPIENNRSENSVLETKNVTENVDTDESTSKVKLSNSRKNETGDKPWYEVSDDDDLLTSHHFKMISISVRSSSEDEAEGITT